MCFECIVYIIDITPSSGESLASQHHSCIKKTECIQTDIDFDRDHDDVPFKIKRAHISSRRVEYKFLLKGQTFAKSYRILI